MPRTFAATARAGASSAIGRRRRSARTPNVRLRRQRQRLKARSIEAYEGLLRTHVLPAFGESTSVSSITRAQVRDFLLERLAEGYRPGACAGCSP
jgi:hypothetical protein